jgi:hypothetical protein
MKRLQSQTSRRSLQPSLLLLLLKFPEKSVLCHSFILIHLRSHFLVLSSGITHCFSSAFSLFRRSGITSTSSTFAEAVGQISRGEGADHAAEALLAKLTSEERISLLHGNAPVWED